MLKRIQKRAERKDREVAPLKSKKSPGKEVAISESEKDEEAVKQVRKSWMRVRMRMIGMS
jgi:hypothetical protein